MFKTPILIKPPISTTNSLETARSSAGTEQHVDSDASSPPIFIAPGAHPSATTTAALTQNQKRKWEDMQRQNLASRRGLMIAVQTGMAQVESTRNEPRPPELTQTKLTENKCTQTELTQAMVTQAMLAQATLTESTLTESTLRQAMLRQAMLREATLREATFEQRSTVPSSTADRAQAGGDMVYHPPIKRFRLQSDQLDNLKRLFATFEQKGGMSVKRTAEFYLDRIAEIPAYADLKPMQRRHLATHLLKWRREPADGRAQPRAAETAAPTSPNNGLLERMQTAIHAWSPGFNRGRLSAGSPTASSISDSDDGPVVRRVNPRLYIHESSSSESSSD